MSLINLFSPPSGPDTMSEWTFSNMADHIEIADAIMRQKGVAIVQHPLDPVTQASLPQFLAGHYAMHVQESLILGIDLFDFLIDPTNFDDFLQNLYQHGDQHRRERAALGI
jgi:hypothetical protein